MTTLSSGPVAGAYRRVIGIVNKLEGAILIISVLLMAGNNIANVVGRVVFNQSLFFAEELNSIRQHGIAQSGQIKPEGDPGPSWTYLA